MEDHYDTDALRSIQREYAARVIERSLETQPKVVGAVDMHLGDDTGVAVAVCMSLPELDVVDVKYATGAIDLPYIPGFLSFREAPVCIEAIEMLDTRPDLLLVDGHGKAHPVRCGVACHIGVELGIPTVGVAKSLLTGRNREPGLAKGETTDLTIGEEIVGKVVRTRENVRPVFVSVGNLITLDEAVDWTLDLARRFRRPEPSHLAHKLASERARELRELRR